MKKKSSEFACMLLLFATMLSACNGQDVAPTATIAPAATETPTPSPNLTPTATPTLPSTETPIPGPASLVGTISLAGDSTKPFDSVVELHQGESFALLGRSDTDSAGVYRIENVDPGTYGLWVLITTEAEEVSGCRDVAPPDATWKLGIAFGGDKALTMQNAWLSKGLMFAENLPGTELQASGFYAVLDELEIISGTENRMDVTLLCK